MSKQQRADLLLVMVAGFWGVSYIMTDIALTELEPLTLNAFRFLSAFLVLGLIFFKKMRHLSRATLGFSVVIGLCLVGVYTCCTYGILYTSLSNAGFICSLPVVTTPILEVLVNRKKPPKKMLFCLIMCAVGLALLTLNETFRPALGDLICLGPAVFYAIDLVVTDRVIRRSDVDPLHMGVCELGVTGVIMLILALILETPHFPATPRVWFHTLFLGIFCSGVAFVVQTVQQKYTTPSHVGLIFTLEPLFAAIVAYFFADEVLRPQGYVGAALMMASLVLMELELPAKKKKPEDRS